MAHFQGSEVNIFGNLGRDPEKFELSNSRDSRDSYGVRFSVAVNLRDWDREDGEYKDTTNWYNCTAFGIIAQQVYENLRSGDYAWVSGNLKQRDYTRQDGTPGTSLDVRVRDAHTNLQLIKHERDSNWERSPDRERRDDRGRRSDRGRDEDTPRDRERSPSRDNRDRGRDDRDNRGRGRDDRDNRGRDDREPRSRERDDRNRDDRGRDRDRRSREPDADRHGSWSSNSDTDLPF